MMKQLLNTLRQRAAAPILGFLFLTWLTNPAWAGPERIYELKHSAIMALEDAFAVLASADIDPDLKYILPPTFFHVVTTAAYVARSSGTVEDRVYMLVNDLGL